jgi:arginine decarboxylase
MNLVPVRFFLTKGVGEHKDELHSFELALRDACIAHTNIVQVSSILPPRCEQVSQEEGAKLLVPGAITFVVMSRISSDEPRRQLSASIGCAKPVIGDRFGYLSEFHGFGLDEDEAGDKAEDLAAAMLASTLGLEFDVDQAWDEKKEIWHLPGRDVTSFNIAVAHSVPKGKWCTVLAAAVFIL